MATVCVSVNSIGYPQSGGQMWAYLNWCLGLQESGCETWWLEELEAGSPTEQKQRLAALKTRLAPFGMANRIALWNKDDKPLPPALAAECPGVESVCGAELLLNLNYGTTAGVIGRFRRSALIDIDPGLLQTWVTQGDFCLAPHDLYFSIGETVGQPDAKFPDLGLDWRYTPPCVALRHWPVVPAPAPAPFTTITHWHSLDWLQDDAGEFQSNEKRTGFLPFVDLPRWTSQILELALHLREKEDAADRRMLEDHGWRVQESWAVASTPCDYQRYIQGSLGEFSCAKPSCIQFQNAWISDRTLCYLASGKPAVVQHTGPSRFLPEEQGLFRFRDPAAAVRALEAAAADYDRHSRLARQLAEEYFDAKKVCKRLLEQALT